MISCWHDPHTLVGQPDGKDTRRRNHTTLPFLLHCVLFNALSYGALQQLDIRSHIYISHAERIFVHARHVCMADWFSA